jgi:hypothetical protein
MLILQTLTPACMMQGGVSEVQNFLAGQGLNASVIADDVKKVSGSATDALTQAKPTVDSTLVTLSKSSPALLAEYALGAVALYYFVSLFLTALPPQRVLLTAKMMLPLVSSAARVWLCFMACLPLVANGCGAMMTLF